MTQTFSFDTRRQIAIGTTEDDALHFAATHFIATAKASIEDHGTFSVALSGGSTPKKLFQLLTSAPYKAALDWEKFQVFWSDERSVGPEDPDSNYLMAMENGWQHVPVSPTQIHRMVAEQDIEENAQKYEDLIRATNKGQFDLIMLGMGDDGHTASLFPHTQALKEKERWVVANTVPQKSTTRMTFTFPLIHKARHTAIYVMGRAKQERVHSVFTDTENSNPIAQVGTTSHPALWILDKEAAAAAPFA